jgi:predicted lipoprotein with Yx(FWY)xxD motif
MMTNKALKIGTLAALGASVLILSSNISFAGHHLASEIKKAETSVGTVLTNAEGLTLYTFDKDEAGKSNCYDSCATNWPPMPAEASSKDDGDFTVVKRKDGTFMWAHDGQPLYTWVGDSAKGDVTGDGVGGVWHVAKP